MVTNFKKYARLMIVIFLFLILIATSAWLIINFRNLYKSGELRPINPLRHGRYNTTKPILQPGQIEGWMTFRYINYIFHLPADYLGGKLGITDLAHLNISLDKYASEHKLNRAFFIELVRQAAGDYSKEKKL